SSTAMSPLCDKLADLSRHLLMAPGHGACTEYRATASPSPGNDKCSIRRDAASRGDTVPHQTATAAVRVPAPCAESLRRQRGARRRRTADDGDRARGQADVAWPGVLLADPRGPRSPHGGA